MFLTLPCWSVVYVFRDNSLQFFCVHWRQNSHTYLLNCIETVWGNRNHFIGQVEWVFLSYSTRNRLVCRVDISTKTIYNIATSMSLKNPIGVQHYADSRWDNKISLKIFRVTKCMCVHSGSWGYKMLGS